MSRSWFDPLERLATALEAEVRAAAAGEGLRPVHLRLLAYLARANRYSDTASAAAEFLGLTKGTVSQSLAVLGRRGLVAARRDPADRRVVHLRLTPEGEAVLGRCHPPGEWEVDGPLAGEAAALLTRLLAAIQRHRGLRTFGVCRSCRFFEPAAGDGGRCGLTGEALTAEDAGRICREHDPTGR